MNKNNDQNFIELKMKMLNWANRFNIFCLLDNNGYSFEHPAFECLLAVGCKSSYTFSGNNDYSNLLHFYKEKPKWLFGHLGYNAANAAYSKIISTDFGDGYFFEPQILLRLKDNNIEVLFADVDSAIIIEEIQATSEIYNTVNNDFNIIASETKASYLQKIRALKKHIQQGDCYEINYCQKFVANNATINIVDTYQKLTQTSPAPFAALYKLNNAYCFCASPERFLQKKGNTLISQPIKGTSKRYNNVLQDETSKAYLLASTKEKSENVMVVDLVRNDMSRVCLKGSVTVKELFGIYSFAQVHQMISTVKGEVSDTIAFTEILDNCFPMGSMTGAPKKRVMELIEQYEETPRGLFSGSIGYINPAGDFDFNVVIRSIFYNSIQQEISFFAGSGITFYSNEADEYDECLMKADAIINILSRKN